MNYLAVLLNLLALCFILKRSLEKPSAAGEFPNHTSHSPVCGAALAKAAAQNWELGVCAPGKRCCLWEMPRPPSSPCATATFGPPWNKIIWTWKSSCSENSMCFGIISLETWMGQWARSSSAPTMWHLHRKTGHVPWLAPKLPLCLDVWCCKPQHNTGDSDARHFLTHFFQNVSLNLCKCMHFAWEVIWKYFPFFFFFLPKHWKCS